MLSAPPKKTQSSTLEKTQSPSSQVLKGVAYRLLPAIDNFIHQLTLLRQRIDKQSEETGIPLPEFPLTSSDNGSDKLLMHVFHDLRAPLQVVLGWSKQLKASTIPASVLIKGLESIERSARLQETLLDDILELYRCSQGKVNLSLKYVDLSMLARLTCESLQVTANNKDVVLRHNFSSSLTVLGDTTRLQQVLWNLISNAIKFTPENGEVCVSGRVEPDSVVLIVSDTGKGIDPEFLAHVFDPHAQQENTVMKSSPSLGLGLAIVQRLVHLHQGTVRAESDGHGCGSKFIVEFPRVVTGDQSQITGSNKSTPSKNFA
jgi:signal transduction histidine kinase